MENRNVKITNHTKDKWSLKVRPKKKPHKKTGKQGKSNPITYQNKDTVNKLLGDYFRGVDLSIYGLDLPRIKDIRPTDLPAVEANELHIDKLFLLEDGSYVLIDYESAYDEKNKQKYLGYVSRLIRQFYRTYGVYIKIHLIIIYTGDVERGTTNPVLDAGLFRMEMTEVFLSDLNGTEIGQELERKIKDKMPLDARDMVLFILYPLTFKGKDEKKKAIRHAITMSEGLDNVEQQHFLLMMLLAFTDKVIDKADADTIRRMIKMTKVEQIIEKEMREEIAKAEQERDDALTRAKKAEQEKTKAVAKAEKAEQEKAEALERAKQTETITIIRIARNLLHRGDSLEEVADSTGLTLSDLQRLVSTGTF